MASITLTKPTSSNITRTQVTASYSTTGLVTSLPTASVVHYNAGIQYSKLDSVTLYINKKSSSTSTDLSGSLTGNHNSAGASFEIKVTASYTIYKINRYVSGYDYSYRCRYTKADGTTGYTRWYSDRSSAIDAVPDSAKSYSVETDSDPIYAYKWKVSDSNEVSSSAYTCYGRPNSWSFSYSNTNYTWIVDKGIQTLITNITEFPGAATKYKNWLDQKNSTSCGTLFDSNNDLSASKINSALSYLGVTGVSYSAGNDVSKAIFDNLESKLK